ncbi:MAG: 3-dehydroquinate synthase [Sandaracinaceae bacterium]|nr:3-dehydroquinate synthase [Sandaracinaceae bacterium]
MDAWVFLSGPMGSGKSTLGRALAQRLGARFVDLDERIEASTGRTVAAHFAEGGEAAFRARERDLARSLLSEPPAVVALGGGTVTDAPTRRALLEAGTLITLEAPLEVLRARIGDGAGRPLAGELEARLAARAGAYAECHARVATDGGQEAALDAILAAMARDAVVVPLGERSYRVAFEHRDGLAGALAPLRPTGVVVVTDDNVDGPWGRAMAEAVGARARVVLTPGEEHKTSAAVERIWDAALEAELDRGGVVVAIGGGVVGDLAGFAAATLLRGVRFVQVPTTTLAMVDSSVGGKTGFDRPQGKNLVGAFHQPAHVLVDVETLTTLPDVELRAGLAEVVKSAWLDSEDAVAALERDAEALLARDPPALRGAIKRSVALKARIVASDEREDAERRWLNLGHTVGHAIEAARGYRGVRHGEAVALGMVAAFRVAASLGDARAVEHGARAAALLARLGLPTDLDASAGPDVHRFVGADKKRRGDRVHFVVPGAPGEVRVVPLPLTHEFGLGGRAPVESSM